jgi:hypothetical protein
VGFKEQQNTIIEFITNTYKSYLPSGVSEPEITTEFLDFDKFKGDFTLFLDFARIDFRQSNYEDDCGDIEHLTLTIYLVHRNNKSSVLNENNLDSANAFYEMIKDKPSFDVAQNTIIESIDFYKYVEGTKYLVVSEIALSLDIEV